jgi:DNA ligase-1
VQLTDLVTTFDAVRATRSRKAKIAAVADSLRQAGEDVFVVATYLSGALTQRRTGVGWRSLIDLPTPATEPSLSISAVDAAFDEIASAAGAGSKAERRRRLEELFAAATEPEQKLLGGLVTGEIRTGALEGVLVDVIAVAYEIPVPIVRRAVMLAGSAPFAARAAASGGEQALAAIGLEVGRAVQPMLAGSAPDLAAGLEAVGLPCLVDGKLDGIRIQVHRSGPDVSVWSRSLDDLTGRFPELVELARSLPATSFVLDGEALLVDDDGRPRAFQDTASRSMTVTATEMAMSSYFFDVLHVDGRDLIDARASERAGVLAQLVPAEHQVPRLLAETPEAAAEFQARVLADGHEGIVLKGIDSTWEAGRRGSGWVKVKPRHTLDLVVLAVEWGSGRREGTLSNIHLGARDDSVDGGGWVMLGKTFKGMTDEMLTWQTERFLELETSREHHVVHVRPEQVVEIAFDGLQRSTRYPGGLALRFARVLRYRDDKRADEADTIETVRALAR